MVLHGFASRIKKRSVLRPSNNILFISKRTRRILIQTKIRSASCTRRVDNKVAGSQTRASTSAASTIQTGNLSSPQATRLRMS